MIAGQEPGTFLEHIPQLSELLAQQKAKQAENRELDFLGRQHDICGIKVRTMTVLDFCILTHKQSPLLYKINPTIADLLLFLWVLNPGKRSLWRAYLFGRKCRKLNLEKAAVRCFEYVDSMLADFPAGNAGGESFVSFVAYWCHQIWKTYHCSEDEFFKMSLPKLFQFLRLIKQDTNPGAPESNPDPDKTTNRVLKDLNAGLYTLDDLMAGRVNLN